MRKYLMQQSLNAFTIQLSKNLEFKSQGDILLENDFSIRAADMFANHFSNFIKDNTASGFEDLPVFNFLSTFYNVQFVEETEEWFSFNLLLNKDLNESMFLRLKHTVFNQYNALIGFSEVLKEVEFLDDTDRLLIHRVNDNVRDMFKDSKLLLEFEQLKNLDFEIKSHLVSPLEYLSSYLRHRHDREDKFPFKYSLSDFKNIVLNIDSEYFKNSLDLLFAMLKETIDLSKSTFQLELEEQCIWTLEYNNDAFDNTEFVYELQAINDFYEHGINISHTSSRMFHLIYIRLIVEKLGGLFKISFNALSTPTLLVEWIFPYEKQDILGPLNIEVEQASIEIEKTTVVSEHAEMYPLALRREIASHFAKVDGTYVLDDWKAFADKLDILIVNCKASNVGELNQIIENIRSAVNGFDVTALQKIMTELKQISKME